MREKIILDDLIKLYIKENLPEKEIEAKEVIELVTEKVKEDIHKEIIEIEKDRIYKEYQDEVTKTEDIKKKRAMRVLIIETLVLGGLIGLLVNQGTDIITYLKGGNINVGQTMLWILILIMCNFLFGFLIYLDKLVTYFKKKEE
ncbi:MAG: hypothetical protein ACRCX8_05595 [Sarcina sp.]